MQRSAFLVVLLSCISIGCSSPGKRFARLWFYTHTNSSRPATTPYLTPASFLFLKKDGSYTRDIGSYEYGNWRLEEHVLILTNYKDKVYHIPVRHFKGNEMELEMPDKTLADFESLPGSFATPGRNPFSPENNVWRISATRKESDNEIRARLRSHFRFWEAYFAWALDNELGSVDVRSTPSPIKIYGNGFTLKSFEDLPAEWKSFFFDAEDCQKANDKLSYIFEHSDIAWANTQNKYKMFLSAFQQLQEQVK